MKLNQLLILSAILLLALFLRIYQLDQVPLSLFGDELDVGYQAYSILHSGKDYFGNTFPLMFQSYAEHRLPVFIYSAVPFIAVFGLNEWGVRLTGVFWGMLGLLGIYLLCQQLFKNQKLSLISLFLLGISPWHIQYSRQGGIEAELLLTFLTFGVWSFLKGVDNYKWLLFSAFLFASSVYCYATSILFTPLLILLLVFVFRKKIFDYGIRKLAVVVILALVVLSPYLTLFVTGKSGERFSTISIASDQSLINDINFRLKLDNSKEASLFHNKPVVYFNEWAGNYLRALSSEFLFRLGDPNLRHSVGDMGEFYLFEIIALIAGLIYLISIRNNNSKLLIGWVLITPVTAALTRDGGYHASRLIPMLVPLTIISAAGIDFLFKNGRKHVVKALLIITFIVAIYNLAFYFHRYYVDWRRDSWRFWQTGYKEALNFIKDNDKNYSRVYFNDTFESSGIRFLFWYEYDPNLAHQEFNGVVWHKNVTKGFDGYKISDKYYFGTVNEGDKGAAVERLLRSGEVYLVSARDEADFEAKSPDLPGRLRILKTIYSPFKVPIFYIVTKI